MSSYTTPTSTMPRTTAAQPAWGAAADAAIDPAVLAQWRWLASRRRPEPLPTGLDMLWAIGSARGAQLWPRRGSALRAAARIEVIQRRAESLKEAELTDTLADCRAAFRRGKADRAIRENALAHVAEAARRSLGMRPYRVQLAGAVVLSRGQLAEMATGEGKTLTAALASVLIGWRGQGCHVVTVNDYLAQRDAETARSLLERCGLSVRHLSADMPPEERRTAYAAPVTYATQKELAADYLRDTLVMQKRTGLAEALIARVTGDNRRNLDGMVMRGLAHAIVDEADSVLIDEAATPLILSAQSGDEQMAAATRTAATLAPRFNPGEHYHADARHRDIRWTRAGKAHIDTVTQSLEGPWQSRRLREELLYHAVVAREHYRRDEQYVVLDEKVVIVDASTGRIMPDRQWRGGIHQAVEAKEQLEVSPIKETLARISFQRFFRSYRALSGMTGTGYEARHELWRVYNLPVVRIPRHKPLARRDKPCRVFSKDADRWLAIAKETAALHQTRRAILIGTASVEDSERLSNLLTEQAIPHRVLNAVYHEEEAAIIAEAGQPGAVTVATNMAGRGTDIILHPGVRDRGGLHVIAAKPNASARIDRQLLGRGGRQGDPGSSTRYAALTDELAKRFLPKWSKRVLPAAPHTARRLALQLAQRRSDHHGSQQRLAVVRNDDWLETHLGFAPENI